MQIEWENASGALEVIDFDATPRHTFETAADVTEHAVETGAAISDHVRVQGDRVSFEAIVSNTPIVQPRFGMDGVTLTTGPVTSSDGKTSFTAQVASGAFDRVRAVDNALAGLLAAGQVVRVVTSLRTIEDLVIERYHVERDASTGDALPVSIDFRRVRIANSERADVPEPAERRGQRSQNRGVVPAVPIDPRSALARSVDASVQRMRDAGLLGRGR